MLLYYFTIIRKTKAKFLDLCPQLHNLESLDKLIKATLCFWKPNVLSTVSAIMFSFLIECLQYRGILQFPFRVCLHWWQREIKLECCFFFFQLLNLDYPVWFNLLLTFVIKKKIIKEKEDEGGIAIKRAKRCPVSQQMDIAKVVVRTGHWQDWNGNILQVEYLKFSVLQK